MKIEDVEAIPYQIPFRKPLKFASGQITHTEHVLIRIRTSDGFIGIADAPARPYVLLTTLFTDIVGSTELLTTHGDAHWCRRLAMHDNIVETRNWSSTGSWCQATGDGIFALFDSPTNAARCGLDLVSTLATRGLRICAAVHTGKCERRGDEWSGVAVHLGARIVELAHPGEVLTQPYGAGPFSWMDLDFDERGRQQLKGLPEPIHLYRARNGRH